MLLADDQAMVRDALERFLNGEEDLKVIDTARNGWEAVEKAHRSRAQIVILDLFMPLLNGLECSRQILRGRQGSAVIILSEHERVVLAEELMKAGVRGYLDKSNPARELLTAIRRVASGGIYLDSTVKVPSRSNVAPHQALEYRLTSREREVLQLIAKGCSTKEIARVLDTSSKTADHHRENLMRKLDIHGVAGLTRFAIRNGYILS